jgi:hypothetical protein
LRHKVDLKQTPDPRTQLSIDSRLEGAALFIVKSVVEKKNFTAGKAQLSQPVAKMAEGLRS